LWIISGRMDLETIWKFNSKMSSYSDDGKTLSGAYGPKFWVQWKYLIECLEKDPTSRQAVMTIWERNPPPSKDIPCTICAQFIIRNGQMHGLFTMRSSDAWLGIPHDCFTFSQIINMMAGVLHVKPGLLYLTLGSSHLYEQHWDLARKLLSEESKMKFYKSPKLPDFVPSHQILENVSVLKTKGYQIWEKYQKALHSGTSAKCFEILTGE